MGEEQKRKIDLKMILIVFLLSVILMIMTTPIHETAHWVMSDIDPYIDPIEIHLFDFESKNNDNILSSALGYVVIRESFPGAFDERPIWMDFLQEVICIIIQMIITLIITLKFFKLFIKKNFVMKQQI